jgi:hypothetical protein
MKNEHSKSIFRNCVRRTAAIAVIALPIILSSCSRADEPKEVEHSVAPQAVSPKGEHLIAALATTNPPIGNLPSDQPVIPRNFDWKEYRRVIEAIDALDANALEVWPSIVEHMTDTEHCTTVEHYESFYNYTVGEVCFILARNWVNRPYRGAMPGDNPLYEYQAPNNMDAVSLQKWLRGRHDKPLFEIQIESAEWALTFVRDLRLPSGLDWETERTDLLGFIKGRIAELRENQKPFPGMFFSGAIFPIDDPEAKKE